MSSDETRGQFVWHDLMTTDTAGAGAFYPRVAGWKTQPWDKDGSYTLWIDKAGPMGGVLSLPKEAAASHWMPYIGTPDVAATIEAARSLGASVLRDATDIPDTGTFAVLQDPQGAVFAVYKPLLPQAQDSEPGAQPSFSWHELSTADFNSALRFYMELFGWGKGPTHDMGELGHYQIFTHGGKDVGGMFSMLPGVTTPHWLSYVRVEDVGRATQAAKSAGGRVIHGPMEVPGGDLVAQLVDPQGAAFAVHQVKRRSAPQEANSTQKSSPAPRARPARKAKTAKKTAATSPARKAAPKRKKRVAAKARRAAPRKAKGKVRLAVKARRAVRKRVVKVKRAVSKRVVAVKRAVKAKTSAVRKKRVMRRVSLARMRLAARKAVRRLRARRRR